VASHGLGLVYHPRAVLRFDRSEVEPDLMVRQPHPKADKSWDTAPVPILIVEASSGSTRRRDRLQKRNLYLDAGVVEYWMVDHETLTITSVRSGHDDVVTGDRLIWSPPGVTATLTIEVARLFA
jgi:Uma2 family endonuclease